jgi:DNA polymerase III epsilon subunit-like protein
VLFPGRNAQQLDDWLAEFGIAAHGRHDALGDAFSSAQLLLILLAEAARQRVKTAEALIGLQRGGRWLSP